MNKELHFGVAVGIDHYPELSKLNFARKDATHFGDWLVDPHGGGLSDQNVEVISHPNVQPDQVIAREDALPIRRTVYNAILRFMKKAKQAVEDDPVNWFDTRLYFYVSGHGIALDARDASLLMADASLEHYGENVSCRALLDTLGKMQPFAEVVAFADCCRDQARGAAAGFPNWTLSEVDNAEVNTALGVAAEFGKKAYEPDIDDAQDPDEFRGYFTTALLEGLYGKVMAPEVNTLTLARYVDERVRELLEHDSKKSQKCRIYGDMSNPIVFGPSTSSKHQLEIKFDTDFHGTAIVTNGDSKEVGRKSIEGAGTKWSIALDKGIHRVMAASGDDPGFKMSGYFTVVGGNDVVV